MQPQWLELRTAGELWTAFHSFSVVVCLLLRNMSLT